MLKCWCRWLFTSHKTKLARTYTSPPINYVGTRVTMAGLLCHYINPSMSQCWPRFMLQYGVTRPQWLDINLLCITAMPNLMISHESPIYITDAGTSFLCFMTNHIVDQRICQWNLNCIGANAAMMLHIFFMIPSYEIFSISKSLNDRIPKMPRFIWPNYLKFNPNFNNFVRRSQFNIPSKLLHKSHLTRQWNCWSFRYSWSIACRRCSNFIFTRDLTLGFNGLGKDNCRMRRGSFK